MRSHIGAMTSRRGFLRMMGLASAGLVVGDAALEAFERLTHVRKSFPSAPIPPDVSGVHGHYIDVRDFGARGDGITFDLPAIQRAINAAGRSGGIVVFPEGTYNTIPPFA